MANAGRHPLMDQPALRRRRTVASLLLHPVDGRRRCCACCLGRFFRRAVLDPGRENPRTCNATSRAPSSSPWFYAARRFTVLVSVTWRSPAVVLGRRVMAANSGCLAAGVFRRFSFHCRSRRVGVAGWRWPRGLVSHLGSGRDLHPAAGAPTSSVSHFVRIRDLVVW